MIFEDKELAKYYKKTQERTILVMNATNQMVVYFVTNGDTIEDATSHVEELSTEIAPHIRPYELGNTQPLRDAINASSLPFMDAAAKTHAIDLLTYNPE